MVSSVLELLEAGESVAEILEDYPPLTPRHVEAALHFAAEAVASGKFAPAA